MDGWSFVERVDALLQNVGQKRVTMCKEIGISKSMLSTWQTRGNVPSADVVYRIAKYLDVSMEYLITGKEVGGISLEEKRIIKKISILSQEDKQIVENLIDGLCKKYEHISQSSSFTSSEDFVK